MSLFLALRRATLLIASGPQNDLERKHLFILLHDPVEDGSAIKRVSMVSLSSVKVGTPHDPTCILFPGEHPFVTRRSFVYYSGARIEDANKLLKGIKDGIFIAHEPRTDGHGGIHQDLPRRIAMTKRRCWHSGMHNRAWSFLATAFSLPQSQNDAMKKMKYNSANKNYYQNFTDVYNSVLVKKAICILPKDPIATVPSK